jgi:hypothetical protein
MITPSIFILVHINTILAIIFFIFTNIFLLLFIIIIWLKTTFCLVLAR